MNRIFKVSMLLSMASLLVACGGGGGGGSSSSAAPGPGTTPAGPLTITPANALAAAKAMNASLVFTAGAGTQAANAPNAAVVSVTGKGFNIVDFSSALFEKVNSLKSQLIPTAIGIVSIRNSPCKGGGSVDVTLDDVDNSGALSTGDRLSLIYNNCTERGVTVSGGLSISNFFFLKPSSVAFSSSGTISFNSFIYSDGLTNGTMNGTFNFSVSTNDGNFITSTITGASLTVTETSTTLILSGYSMDQTNDISTGAFTLSANGTVNSSALGGSVTFTTSTPFRGTGTSNPNTGVVKINGVGSSVTLTVLDSTNVRLDVDSNGDGVTNSVINTTWAVLDTF